jgi:hypothetical protein
MCLLPMFNEQLLYSDLLCPVVVSGETCGCCFCKLREEKTLEALRAAFVD